MIEVALGIYSIVPREYLVKIKVFIFYYIHYQHAAYMDTKLLVNQF